MVGPVTHCRACGGRLTVTMADLGLQPASNAFIANESAFQQEKRYPLRAKVCESCKLVQVDYDVSPEELFGNYHYFSSYSDDWLAHAKAYCDMARKRFALDSSSLVVELASNDGYLLKNFLSMGIPVLGIDPSDRVAAAAEKIGVPTLVEFFGERVAGELASQGRQADLIIVELIEQVEFDTIYHEHFSYFSVHAIEQVFARHGLRLYDVERLPTHGGSLRIFAAHAARSDLEDSAALREVRAQEGAAGLAELATYTKFSKRVDECRGSLLKFLAAAKREGKRVAAYGAAAKGNTLLNFCGVTPSDIAFVADRSPHKQGKFLPGTHIPVVSPEELMRERPEYVLILPWNLQDEIRQQLDGIKAWGGRFVTPVPVARILSDDFH